MPTPENVRPRFVKKKTSNFVKWTTPSRNTAYIWQIRNTLRPTFSTTSKDRTAQHGQFSGECRSRSARLTRFLSSLHRLHIFVSSRDNSRTCLIETSSSASATPCPCPTSSGEIIEWSHKVGNTSAFVHSTTTPSPHLESTNGMENGGTSASPVVPVETASRT